MTQPANELIRPVIDRMPVILPECSWQRWLEPEATREVLEPLLATRPSEEMEGWPVTRKVNRRGFEGPECIARLPEQQDGRGLKG